MTRSLALASPAAWTGRPAAWLVVAGLFAVGGLRPAGTTASTFEPGFPRSTASRLAPASAFRALTPAMSRRCSSLTRPGGDVTLVLRLKPALRELIGTDAAAQIVSEGMVGGKVVEIFPGTAGDRAADNAQIATLPSTDLNEMLAHVGTTLQGIKSSDGTIGKLVNDPEAYVAFLRLMQQGERTLASVQQDAEALRRCRCWGGYIENPTELPVGVNCERNRWWFPENDLFESGRAVLTVRGRQLLDELAPKMIGFKQKGTEVVIVSYADPRAITSEVGLLLTRQRSEAVTNYLKDKHSIHGPGWLSSARKVTPVGMGVRPAPIQESDNPPAAGTEVLVFVPQG